MVAAPQPDRRGAAGQCGADLAAGDLALGGLHLGRAPPPRGRHAGLDHPTTQAVQITGCAASQSAVAATMVALGRVHGVGSVSLASTSNTASSSSGSAPAASGSGSRLPSGGCRYPVNFSLSLRPRVVGELRRGAPATTTPASSTPPARNADHASSAGHPVNRKRPMTLRKRDRSCFAVLAAVALLGAF